MHEESPQALTRRAWLGATTTLAAGIAAAQSPTPPEPHTTLVRIPAWYYQHFDADYTRDVPEEGFGGWKQESLDFARDHLAVVCMHAWDAGTPEAFPGWWRCVPYLARATQVSRDIFPGLFATIRASGIPLFHVVGGGDYYKDLPGYQHATALASPTPPSPERIPSDPIRDRLDQFRNERVFVGKDNAADVQRGFAHLDFLPEARPQGDEGIAENAAQLFALCKESNVNHLVYCGFAINWCLLLSPGGMADMQRHGMLCSALRQATVAVENKESARGQLAKELALWRVALAFGFVFDVDDFTHALAPRG